LGDLAQEGPDGGENTGGNSPVGDNTGGNSPVGENTAGNPCGDNTGGNSPVGENTGGNPCGDNTGGNSPVGCPLPTIKGGESLEGGDMGLDICNTKKIIFKISVIQKIYICTIQKI